MDDVNEYQPRFKQRSYHTRIGENVSISSNVSILNVVATDDDCSDRVILYSIITDQPLDVFPFEISRFTGSIFVKSALDFEKIATYRFSVKASNLDQITSNFVPVRIDVLDVNDNSPLIQTNLLNEYKAATGDEEQTDLILNINENVRAGQVLGTILVRDADSAMINRKLTLKILSCWPPKNVCPIEIDSGMENSEDGESIRAGSTNYLLRTSRPLDSEASDEKFTVVLEARSLIFFAFFAFRFDRLRFRRLRRPVAQHPTSNSRRRSRSERLSTEVSSDALPISVVRPNARRFPHRTNSGDRSRSFRGISARSLRFARSRRKSNRRTRFEQRKFVFDEAISRRNVVQPQRHGRRPAQSLVARPNDDRTDSFRRRQLSADLYSTAVHFQQQRTTRGAVSAR